MLSTQAQKFINRYGTHLQKSIEEDAPKIKVDHVASRLATLYEKIHQVIDYHEEHLLRKNTIERMLKRRLFFTKEADELSQGLIEELIRGGYFLNETLPETKISEVGTVLGKYIFIIENLPQTFKKDDIENIRPWLIKIASCEIEETLAPPAFQEVLLEFMFETMMEKISIINPGQISKEFRNTQLFIAVQKTLLKADESQLLFRLFKFLYPQWLELEPSLLPEITENIKNIKKELETQIKHPLNREFYEYCSGLSAPFLIFGDVVREKSDEINELTKNPELLEKILMEAYEERFKICKSKLSRSGLRSVISIFLSKTLMALAIEIPFDKMVVHHFAIHALIFNLTIPPLLMLLVVKSIKAPKAENEAITLLETMKIVYKSREPEIKEIKLPKNRSWVLNLFLDIIYTATYAITFGFIIFGLLELDFSFLSIIIFIVFLFLISFSGLRIKEWSKELKIGEERGRISTFLLDFFGLPIIKVGKWLSREFSKINLLIVFTNLIFEVPFNIFMKFIGDWRQYAKEKKGDIS